VICLAASYVYLVHAGIDLLNEKPGAANR